MPWTKAAAQASHCERQRVRVVAPVRLVEPGHRANSCPTQESLRLSAAPSATISRRWRKCLGPLRSGRCQRGVREGPVKPADSDVLAISVVVAPLGPAHLVAHEQHRRAGRQHEREKILHLTIAQRFDRGSRSALRRRNSNSSCRSHRRGFPRRWPRCACRCTRRGRSA